MRIGVVAPASIGNKDAEAPFLAFSALAYPEVDLKLIDSVEKDLAVMQRS